MPQNILKIHNVLIPRKLRGFDSEADRFDVDIQGRNVIRISPSRAASPGGSGSRIPGSGHSLPSGTLLPCFADLHVHIDKTYVVDDVGAAKGNLRQAIGLMAAHRDSWTAADLLVRMTRAIAEAYAFGTRAMRTHLDWVDARTPRSLAVFESLRDEWRDRVALQCVSLTPLDMFTAEIDTTQRIAFEIAQTKERCQKSAGEDALLGAFVYCNDQLEVKLQRVFELADQFNLNLDFHVDEGLDRQAQGLRVIALLTQQYGFEGRVTCGHACSLSVQSDAEALETLRICAKAQIHLVALPSTNLYLQGAWDTTPIERGVTRLKEARACGVAASVATDNVADGFFPYGSYDLLDAFGLGVQIAHLSPAADWLDTITTHPARAMGLPWHGKLAEGCPADLVLLRARNGYELLTAVGRKREVIRGGKYLLDQP